LLHSHVLQVLIPNKFERVAHRRTVSTCCDSHSQPCALPQAHHESLPDLRYQSVNTQCRTLAQKSRLPDIQKLTISLPFRGSIQNHTEFTRPELWKAV
jgi:hypothetical protein